MSRNPHPEVDVPRPLPLRALAREALRGLARDGVPRWRSTAAVFTSMTALAATSLVPGHALAESLSSPCALTRTEAHHSEGIDTWNSAYARPTRPLDALMVFLSFPDSTPRTTPAELTGDYFPATSRFFERASYGRFTVRPHPRRAWIQMPRPSTSYAIQRDWGAADRAAYLRDALAVADPEVDFSRYDVVYFVADPDAPGVDSDATKVVNLDAPLHADGKDIRRVVTVFEKHPPDRLVLAHETGHVFDLPDLYHRPADGEGDWDTYVGDWDLMGSQFGLSPDLFGWHKWRLGWLEPHQVACVQGSGVTRLTLEPLGAGPVGSTTGARTGTAGAGVLAAGSPAGRSGPVASWRRPVEFSRGSDAAPYGPPTAARASGASGASSYGLGVAAAPGSGTFGVGGGTKLVVIRTGPDSAIAVEGRGAVGNDRSTCTQGVLVYRVRSGTESGGGPIQVLDAHPHAESCWEDSVYPPLADAPVGLGESFSVPGAKVRVDVEDRTASGAWTVRITTG
ncbi:M6 family metalloprotease domain-containing protein [Streptomyces sp. NPDC002580]|uniref:M6 family metalloprotease domain-containing protein n=1 Tax=Streptomyces sp. NPDC002580 TaxID=3364653 RepID=UPI00368CCF1B